jgi:GNAT superfamily N-acetyltransferase
VNRTQRQDRTQHCGEAWSAGGVRIRPVAAGDRAAIAAFVAGLSSRSRFLRFFTTASPPSSAVLRGMCGAGLTADALVATEGATVIGHAMAADRPAPDGVRVCDVGLVVADRWQRQGLGSALFFSLQARAAARGVGVLSMDVLPENRVVLALISRTWADAAWEFTPDAVTITAGCPAGDPGIWNLPPQCEHQAAVGRPAPPLGLNWSHEVAGVQG